jgi:hypothetical protein
MSKQGRLASRVPLGGDRLAAPLAVGDAEPGGPKLGAPGLAVHVGRRRHCCWNPFWMGVFVCWRQALDPVSACLVVVAGFI